MRRWRDELTTDKLLDAADDLSAEKARACVCESNDYLHVAAARRLHLLAELEEFWTCDAAQAMLARSVGLKTSLFEL